MQGTPKNQTTAPRERSHANDTGWHLPSRMKSLQKYQWIVWQGHGQKGIQAEQRGILTLRDLLSLPQTRQSHSPRVPEGEQCPPGAGSFAKLGCGPGRGYPWRERDGEPWHSLPQMALGSLHHPTSSQVTSSPGGAAGWGCPQPRCSGLTQTQLPALHTRLCRLGLSWSCDCFFFPTAGTLTPGSRATHDTQQGSVPLPWLSAPAPTALGTSGTEGWTLLECNSSLCRRPGHLLLSGATRVMKVVC